MQTHQPTTPFGRRPLTLAHVAAQVVASQRPPDKVVHKWKVFRAICIARPQLGVSERALSVLNALLSFYPETTLSGDDLVVFPSNEQLSLRAHGMPASTLRRHLAGLVDAGLVLRRDSPNGKRYARKGREGSFSSRSASTSRRSSPAPRNSKAWLRRSKQKRAPSNSPGNGSRSAGATSLR